jgi:ubiquinone/menaquinone biosynthesis C-methylase UbiE
VATGTGGVALVAARTGAEVVGLDISAAQLAKASTAASEAGLSIRFDEGDVQEPPYEGASFDMAASAFGIIFAPDSDRAAAELARVVRSGGRVAITSWTDDDWDALSRSVGRKTADEEYLWAREETAVPLLGDAFELQLEEGEWQVQAESAEALWELISTSAPPLKAFLDGLDDDDRREEIRRRYVEFFGSGEIRRRYVLVLGTRR